jgi:EAL domain-containing protein (putative c-di-GMP-specific phosphodiesterase class I)
MYAAKSSGKNRYHLFTGELTNLIKEQVQLINDLKRALKNEEFVLHYQPIFRANDESLHGVEALIRWAHPEKGLLSPIHFITTAEKNGLIGGITDWVLLESFRQTKAWLDKGCHFDRVSINLSAENIKLGFHEQVARLLKQTQCPSKHLQFEITETIVMEHGLGVIAELEKVRLLGITIALDDFGTGYSSLNQLKRLPVDKLKIDRSFIQDIPHDADDVTLTNMIIAMSKHLSLSVVAEGVETEEQATFLKQAGCDYLQGFLYAKPMSEVELCRLFKPI